MVLLDSKKENAIRAVAFSIEIGIEVRFPVPVSAGERRVVGNRRYFRISDEESFSVAWYFSTGIIGKCSTAAKTHDFSRGIRRRKWPSECRFGRLRGARHLVRGVEPNGSTLRRRRSTNWQLTRCLPRRRVPRRRDQTSKPVDKRTNAKQRATPESPLKQRVDRANGGVALPPVRRTEKPPKNQRTRLCGAVGSPRLQSWEDVTPSPKLMVRPSPNA